MRLRPRVIAALTALTLTCASAFAVSAPASAMATCNGNDCTGKNPDAYGCGGDAQTLDKVTPAGGGTVIELRYSPKCNAAWAKDTLTHSWHFSIQGSVANGGPPVLYMNWACCENYTAMISFTYFVRACARPATYPIDDQSSWTCTRWH
jgi:hypothetical protein